MHNYKFNFTKLAVDLASNKVQPKNQEFNNVDPDEVLRKAFLAHIGTDKIDYQIYRRNKTAIFEIIEETITPVINDRLAQVMGRFAEVRNMNWGDKAEFIIEDPSLFEVSVTVDGTGNLNRQRLDNGKLEVKMKNYSISIYDEFYRFLAGQVRWAYLIDKVAKSWENKIAQDVNNALFGAYPSIDAAFKFSGTYDEDEIIRVCQNIEAYYGSAMIVGTKAALKPLKPVYGNDITGNAYMDEYNRLGHIGRFYGYETVALEQSFKPGTYDFAINNKDLLIIPANSDRFVKIVTEGTPLVFDEHNTQGDLSMEHTFIQKAGVAVSLANVYGLIQIV